MTRETVHKSVLLNETIDSLSLTNGSIVVDATLGGAGHSLAILRKFGGKVKLVGIDADSNAIEGAKERLGHLASDASFVVSNYRKVEEVLEKLEIDEVDAFIFDLGLSSDQLEFSGRGFSFNRDEELLMTLESNPIGDTLTAIEIVNNWSEESIRKIIEIYGEDRFGRKIAKAIIDARAKKPIATSGELKQIIENVVPRRGKINPATKTFQALRIVVNDEMEAIKEGIEGAFKKLKKGGRIAVISFHSLEDRIIKNLFKEKVNLLQAKLINKKPIIPTREEIKENSRSRSAKLRVIEKI